jgi:SpoVK/Ycf46/Vps4 family AAA+-type ATPase
MKITHENHGNTGRGQTPFAPIELDDKAGYFSSNMEHLHALEHEAKIRLLVAYMKNTGKIPEGCNFCFLNLLEGKIAIDDLEALLDKVQAENKLKARNTVADGMGLNLERLCRIYNLNDYERIIVMLLLFNSTSAAFRRLYRQYAAMMRVNGSAMNIETLLSIIGSDYCGHLELRKYFTMESRLVKEDIILLDKRSERTDVMDTVVYLHERIVSFITGDNNYNTAMRYISRERNEISIDKVVMPDKLKEDILKLAENYINNRQEREALGIDKFYSYGTGLVFMFYGPSGTGKTMLAHALATRLNKPILSMNIGTFLGAGADSAAGSFKEAIDYIFKEARLTDGIVFFDECDNMFRKNTHASSVFLTGIEKSRCMTILASNRLADMDNALDRRITMKVCFEIPCEDQRERLWKALLPDNVKLSEDVNLKELAKKFIFTGGLIKNTIYIAANNALKKVNSSGILLTTDELKKAADYQAVNIFESDGAHNKYSYTPKADIKKLPLKPEDKDELQRFPEIYQKLSAKGLGMNVIIGASDIKTGIKAVEAVASMCGFKIRRFFMGDMILSSDRILVPDSISQKEISLLDFAFKDFLGHKSITLFVDFASLLEKCISPDKETPALFYRFLNKLQGFKGLSFLVTRPFKGQNIPIEFCHYMELSPPPREMQVKLWKGHLKNVKEEEIAEIAERNPLYPDEIDFIANQAGIRSYIKGGDGTVTLELVHEIIKRYKKAIPSNMLFGQKK